ncbi:MAG TPA: hypothetical protein VIL09_17825 [Microvirga sp.]|jgi:hypothetical protein
MQPFNLFRTKGRDALFCAVPEARSVPPFLTGQQWVYTGRLSDPREAPIGFDDRAAATGVRFNGFYLFSDFRGEPRV